MYVCMNKFNIHTYIHTARQLNTKYSYRKINNKGIELINLSKSCLDIKVLTIRF